MPTHDSLALGADTARSPAPPDAERPVYRQLDVSLGDITLAGVPLPLRLRIEQGRTPGRRRTEQLALQHGHGEPRYLHVRPYLTVGRGAAATAELAAIMTPWPRSVSDPAAGPPMVSVGRVRAWRTPSDSTLTLWECTLDQWFWPALERQRALETLWAGCETALTDWLRDIAQIVTPLRQPGWPMEARQAFLRARGYRPLPGDIFVTPWRS